MFLHTLYPDMRAPTVARDIVPITQYIDGWDGLDDASKTRTLLTSLLEKGTEYTPRWLAVLLTSMAELDAREATKAGTPTVPWVNMKFSASNSDGVKKPAAGDPALVTIGRFGVSAIGDSMNMVEQARFKYHINLGGGGGTTWTGESIMQLKPLFFISLHPLTRLHHRSFPPQLVRYHREARPPWPALPPRHAHARLDTRPPRAVGALRPR